MDKVVNKSSIEVLHCLIENVHICIDVDYINKTVLLPMLNPVPGCPNYVVGLMNLSGKGVLVIDLALRAGLKRHTSYSLDTPILICCYQSYEIGVVVDQVLGLEKIDKYNVQYRKEFDNQESIFLATALINSTLALLINMDFLSKGETLKINNMKLPKQQSVEAVL